MEIQLRLCAALLLASALAACGMPASDSQAEQVQLQLTGTWLRDYEENGARVRRVLVLAPDGHCEEMSNATQADAILARHQHSGDWYFDGINLKRRYTLIDGQKPIAPSLPYVALAVSFASRNEFIGTDHVRRRELRYQRVADGTLP